MQSKETYKNNKSSSILEKYKKYNEEDSSDSSDDEDENKLSRNKEKMIRSSFYITYAFLMTTATITFIEAIRTSDKKIRNILNLETCISVVAAFFYGRFVGDIKNKEIEFKKINVIRYTDWAITTPIMLLVLCLAFLYNTKGGALSFGSFLTILILNYFMLLSGYAGETGRIGKTNANIIGFVFFALMYGFIYHKLLYKKYNFDNQMLFWAFVILWAGYGVLYEFNEITRNVGYNILDLLSKCFVGIFFWAYYAKVFKIP